MYPGRRRAALDRGAECLEILATGTVHAGEHSASNFGPLSNDENLVRRDHLTMKTTPRQIVAFGGGGFSMESGNPLLDDYVLGLSTAERPRICFLPSASGDADHYIVRFYRAFPADRCEASHISLFRREQGPDDLRRHLLSQDLIYVGGGSVVSLLGVWRAHGIDADPARSLGGRHHPLRPLGRVALLVCGGGDRLPRRAAPVEGLGLAAVQQLRPLRTQVEPAPFLPRLPARRDAIRATRPRTVPHCTSSAQS